MVICLTLFVFSSCSDFGVPEHIVIEHIKQIVRKEIGDGFNLNITSSSSSGEGDADTVYQHIQFNVVATHDQYIKLSKQSKPKSIKKGQMLVGEIEIFYQRNGNSWKMIDYWVNGWK